MGRAIEKDGKTFRMRRGKLVEIPPAWVGNTVAKRTIGQRPSKMTGKLRRLLKRERPENPPAIKEWDLSD